MEDLEGEVGLCIKDNENSMSQLFIWQGVLKINSPEVCDFPFHKRANFLLAVWEFLNVLLEQLIAQGGPSAWPSPFLI